MITEQNIIDYVSGKASVEERRAVALWAAESPENREQVLAASKLYVVTLLNCPTRKRASHVMRYVYGAVASVAVIVAFAIHYFGCGRQDAAMAVQTVIVPAGQRTHIVLSDSSSVWVNSNSTLTFIRNEEGLRLVELQGCALFDVAKDPEHMFVVCAGGRQVKVHGTKFNVSNYSGDEFNVRLFEGSVEVSDGCTGHSEMMVPGQQLTSTADGYILSEFSDADRCNWIDGYYSFSDATYAEILGTIGNYMDVKFEILDEKVGQYRCSCTFREEDGLAHFLSVLGEVHPICCKWSEDGSTIFIE